MILRGLSGPKNNKPYAYDSELASTFLVKPLADCPFTNLPRDLLGEVRRTNDLVKDIERRFGGELVEILITKENRLDHDQYKREQDLTVIKLTFTRKF